MNNIKFEYKDEYRLLTNVLLNVTDDCNLRCKYCFTEHHPNYMNLATAKAAVDYVYQNLQEKKKIKNTKEKCSIYFFGGEPLLCYNSIIKPIVNYCYNNYSNENFSFGLTTNGTLLNKEKIDYFKENNFSILLSFDGNEETQNYNRPYHNNKQNSFDLVKKNIPYLLEKYPNITCRSTLFAPTIKNLFENYLYIEKLGFKSWVGIADNRNDWNEQDIAIFEDEMNKIYAYRLNQLLMGHLPMQAPRLDLFLAHTSLLYSKYKNSFFSPQSFSSIFRCGLGTTIGGIGYDGSIYACQEWPTIEQKNIFYIGDIFNGGIDPNKHSILLEKYIKTQYLDKINKEQCNFCDLAPLCKVNCFVCPSASYQQFKNFNTITEVSCRLRKIYIKNSLLLLKIILESNNEFLNNYLNNIIKKIGGEINNE